MIMWQRDCGVVPVVNEQKRVVGVITDRDICIAVSMQNRLASQIQVSEVISGKVKSCKPDDGLEQALKTMRRRQLRRLPVTTKDGVLVGIVSIGDLLKAGKGKDFKKKLFAALREISSLRPIHLHETSAEDNSDQIESNKEASEVENIQTETETDVEKQSPTENSSALEGIDDDA